MLARSNTAGKAVINNIDKAGGQGTFFFKKKLQFLKARISYLSEEFNQSSDSTPSPHTSQSFFTTLHIACNHSQFLALPNQSRLHFPMGSRGLLSIRTPSSLDTFRLSVHECKEMACLIIPLFFFFPDIIWFRKCLAMPSLSLCYKCTYVHLDIYRNIF